MPTGRSKTINPFDDDAAPKTQAERVFAKFGGARGLMRALHAVGRPYNPVSLYRWNYSKARRGSEGLIPTASMADVLAAARHEGVFLSADDLDPRKM